MTSPHSNHALFLCWLGIYVIGSAVGALSQPTRHESFTHDNKAIYAYFETPLKEDDVGHVGPSNWKNLFKIEDNTCGGGDQANGFGQSPVIIPIDRMFQKCHNLESYAILSEATCTMDDLTFSIQKNGLSLRVKNGNDSDKGTDSTHRKMKESHSNPSYEPICHLGKVSTPQGVYDGVEILIKNSAEHFFEGVKTAGEMQIFHIKADASPSDEDEKMVLSYLLDIVEPEDWWSNQCQFANPFIEVILPRFEEVAEQTRDYCATTPGGSGEFNSDTVLRAQQKLIVCGDIQDELANLNDVYNCTPNDYYDYLASYSGKVPDVYSAPLTYTNLTALYHYKGSMTAPPCKENVHWNIAEDYVYLSRDQFSRLTILMNCVVEPSTCRFSSSGSEFGTTSRPPQPLSGRNIVKYCVDEPVIETDPDLSAPLKKAYKIPKPPKVYYALLYPWFATALGMGVFYMLTRTFLHLLPFTAVMFALGTLIGIIVTIRHGDAKDQLSQSTLMWENINSELLLLTFLPGLLFKDAYGLDVHLFQKSLLQITLMGFPMVLGGTLLMSLVGMYVLPFGWSFSLSMTFGAIVSATDPVAVSALLNELGAPPRLKMHISGESLLNDGSAIVFFTIFKNMFLYDLGIHGGKDYSVGEGIEIFAKMSLGAVAVGIAFGTGIVLVLFLLNHRFSHEESIVQVTVTVAGAYLCYYVAEPILHMSGVLAVVICGIFTKAFASSLINDPEMMKTFWEILEHLLNTVLFLLGGLVWGSVISNQDESRPETFSGSDWGYLVLVFLLMTVVRCLMFGLFYPLISRIGLGSNWKEAVFQSFGGLRGAVGIALAIALDNEVIHETVRIDPKRVYTSQLFGITGGISLLTLFVNGVAAGPLLKKLKLGRSSSERHEIVNHYHEQMKRNTLETLVRLLGNDRFKDVDPVILREHLPELKGITCAEIDLAVRRVKETTSIVKYVEPNLSVFEHYYKEQDKDFSRLVKRSKVKLADRFHDAVKRIAPDSESFRTDEVSATSEAKLKELRLVFLELLKTQYNHDITRGYINSRYGDIDFELLKSVGIAEDEVSQELPITTWKHTGGLLKYTAKCNPGKNSIVISRILLASSFVQAHKETMSLFRDTFGQYRFLSEEEKTVLAECEVQVNEALQVMEDEDQDMVNRILSYQLCQMVINHGAIIVEEYVKSGLINDVEAEHIYEHIEEYLEKVNKALISV